MIKTTKKTILLRLMSLILCIITISFCFPLSLSATSVEISGGYTDVLDDLKQLQNFKEEDYPLDENDVSLNVITLAESSDKELFVYVYQPSGENKDLRASTIDISVNEKTQKQFKNMKMSLVNSNGVFYKYRIEDVVLPDDDVRFYEVSDILRKFNALYDTPLDNGNTVSEVPYPVGKLFTFTTSSNGTFMSVEDVDYVVVQDKYVGFVRYEDGNWWHLFGEEACDRHFVAFSTDRKIDELIEADVYYETQSVHRLHPTDDMHSDTWYFGEKTEAYAYLSGVAKEGTSTEGSYTDKNDYVYHWERIQTVDEFISSVNITNTYTCGIFEKTTESKITEEAMAYLGQQEWVLSFAETKYEVVRGSEEQYFSTRVGNVKLMRLKFVTGDITYDLGVVDNKQTGSLTPSNTFDVSIGLTEAFTLLLTLVLVLFLVFALSCVLPSVLNVVMLVARIIVRTVIFILCIPLKLIKSIFGKRKK